MKEKSLVLLQTQSVSPRLIKLYELHLFWSSNWYINRFCAVFKKKSAVDRRTTRLSFVYIHNQLNHSLSINLFFLLLLMNNFIKLRYAYLLMMPTNIYLFTFFFFLFASNSYDYEFAIVRVRVDMKTIYELAFEHLNFWRFAINKRAWLVNILSRVHSRGSQGSHHNFSSINFRGVQQKTDNY